MRPLEGALDSVKKAMHPAMRHSARPTNRKRDRLLEALSWLVESIFQQILRAVIFCGREVKVFWHLQEKKNGLGEMKFALNLGRPNIPESKWNV